MFNSNLDQIFKVSASVTIIFAVIGAAQSAIARDWSVFMWQLISAAGFIAALSQARRANRAEEVR